jgi:DNA-binding NarL/FixJ family response regulator
LLGNSVAQRSSRPGATEPVENQVPQSRPRIAILIVEDQDFMRESLRDYLQSAYPEASILEAANGAQALESCRDRRPRLVLMDVQLPDANGIDVTAQIKHMLPETVIVVVSQHSGAAYVERANAAGAYAYITKDKVYRELLPTVGRALMQVPSAADIDVNDA